MVDQGTLQVNIPNALNVHTATRTQRNHKKKNTNEMPFRSATVINDRRNSRGKEGKLGVKRVKMTHKDEICNFNFLICGMSMAILSLSSKMANMTFATAIQNLMTHLPYLYLPDFFMNKKRKLYNMWLNLHAIRLQGGTTCFVDLENS